MVSSFHPGEWAVCHGWSAPPSSMFTVLHCKASGLRKTRSFSQVLRRPRLTVGHADSVATPDSLFGSLPPESSRLFVKGEMQSHLGRDFDITQRMSACVDDPQRPGYVDEQSLIEACTTTGQVFTRSHCSESTRAR
eukprot:scaffold7444_cov350-Prasinococcus_capsulatus_cf.AAC.1